MGARDTKAEPKRVTVACRRCRQSKLKCSGTAPCERCRKAHRECTFEGRDGLDESAQICTVSGSTEPQKRARPERLIDAGVMRKRLDTGRSRANSDSIPPTSRGVSSGTVFITNRPNQRRTWLYLGASSTWSFNARTASIIQAHLQCNDIGLPLSLDGDAYSVSWSRIDPKEHPDLNRLPSFDYAVYLLNTVKYHLGGIFHLFEEEDFMHCLHRFYTKDATEASLERLWYCQYLLVLAFGKSILNAKRLSPSLPGSEFFTRGMAALPDVSALHEDPVLAIEVLCMVALYFFCLDMRQTAYSYVGQALRIALVEGLHKTLDPEQIGEKFTARCNNVWWTVYILDRTLSANVGAPTSVSDEHVSNTLPSPTHCTTRLATLGLHVKLSRLISHILAELYSANGSLEHSYLMKTRSVLRYMATIGEEMEKVIDVKFRSSFDTITRAATHLRLLYHQCVILAIRPLLLCLLQEKVRSLKEASSFDPTIPTLVRGLVQTCCKSATKTIKILHMLHTHGMLDTFLPFDLEYACAACSVLIVAQQILRCLDTDKSVDLLAIEILDEMSKAGNAVAVLRQAELDTLRRLATHLWSTSNIRAEQSEGVPVLRIADDITEAEERQGSSAVSVITHTARSPPLDKALVAAQAGTEPLRMDQPFRCQSIRHMSPKPGSAGAGGQDHRYDPSTILPVQNDSLSYLREQTPAHFSPTSSQDLVQSFDLAPAEMLSLADQIDLGALDEDYDFGLEVDLDRDKNHYWTLNAF